MILILMSILNFIETLFSSKLYFLHCSLPTDQNMSKMKNFIAKYLLNPFLHIFSIKTKKKKKKKKKNDAPLSVLASGHRRLGRCVRITSECGCMR
jgi:hypothetical protein